MNENERTGWAWVERYNLEDMVSRAIDKKFSRFSEQQDNIMNNETTQMETNDNMEDNFEFEVEVADEDLSPEASEILRVIQESNEPVGRANIIARAGIPAHKWTLAIQELKDQDYVVQHGTRRGAKYTVSKVSSINF